jgi:hypothetical protein
MAMRDEGSCVADYTMMRVLVRQCLGSALYSTVLRDQESPLAPANRKSFAQLTDAYAKIAEAWAHKRLAADEPTPSVKKRRAA